MGFGVLEDHYLEHVPGTSFINDTKPLHLESGEIDTSRLKHAKGGNSHIILVPQPSDDPNDPLNWPIWKKELLYWPMVFAAGLVGAIGPLLTPGFVALSIYFNVTIDKISSSLNGALVLAIGCAMFPMASFAQKYGRRPVFLLASLVLFVTSIWAGATNSLGSLTAARVLQGMAMAPLEALVTATIGDIYFVHERGLRIAIWGFALLGGINIAPIVNGPVLQHLSWQWCFWIISIMFGISFFLMFFTFPETAFNRAAKYEIDQGSHDNLAKLALSAPTRDEKEKDDQLEDVNLAAPIAHTTAADSTADSPPPQKRLHPVARTWRQDLRITSGSHSEQNLFKLILRPAPFFLSPVVIFGTFAYGFTTAWLVVLSVSASLIFSLPPYNFDSQAVGLVSIGPLIGALLAALLSGPFCDWCATSVGKYNGGVYEPEFRLLLMIPALIFQVLGYAVWGSVQSKGGPWIGPVILYSIIDFGQGLASTAVVTYVIDAHRGNVPEAMAVINFVKNVLAFGCTYFVNSWIQTQGILDTMGTLAGLCAICTLPAIPMYIYGKRVRSWVHRHHKLFLTD